MNYIIIKILVVVLFLFNTAYAEEYKLEMFFTNTIDSLVFPDDKQYLHVKGTGVWKDSYGDYGNMKYFWRILLGKLSNTSLDVFCEAKDQNDKKFWLRLERDSDQTDAGIGSTTYLYGDDKYKKFKGKKCIYASKVFGPNAIVNQKCTMNNN